MTRCDGRSRQVSRRVLSGVDWEAADARPVLVNHQNSPRFECLGRGFDRDANPFLLELAQFISNPQENHAGASGAKMEEKLCKIQVLSQDGVPMLLRPMEQFSIRGIRRANRCPMAGFPTSAIQNIQPLRAEVHVHQELHATGTGAAPSLPPAAAKFKQALMSSISRYG